MTKRPDPELLKRVSKLLHARAEEMLATLRALVEMESPSGEKAAAERLSGELESRFAQLGGKTRRHENKDFASHLQVDFDGAAGKPVMLVGHFDTVYDLGSLASTPWKVEKGRAYGPGVYDMKAGIVQMMFAVNALRQASGGTLPCPVRVWLVSDEEVSSPDSRSLTERLAVECAAALICEPAQGKEGALKTARKGVGDYNLRVTGRAAHAGIDFEKGASAVHELARQILAVGKFTDLKRGLTVNPGVVRGGTRSNVVAAEAECEVDVRIRQSKDAVLLEKKFRALKVHDKRCTLEVSGGINRPPMERTAATVELFRIAQKAAKELGFKITEKATGGGSDGNFTSALGVPTLDGLGAVGEGAHAAHENIVVAEMPRRAALLAGVIAGIAARSS